MGAPGCDDAPMTKIELGSEPKPVTFVYPYYENPKFFQRQLDLWMSYPKQLLEHLAVIVVDDGSPTHPAKDVVFNSGPYLNIRLFRIDVDIRWNWLAARNIGLHYARDGWTLLTDMDHMVSEEVLNSLIWGKHDEAVIYRFSRMEHTGQHIHPHPNSWFMTRKMFWKIGGYDEACSGFYGTDGDYRRRCAATAPIKIMTQALVRYEYIDDSSTIRYKRKQPEDAQARKIMRSRQPGWKPKTLSFPHHEVRV